jgi:uncharacterized membrane protein YkvA (DUF1232 family)
LYLKKPIGALVEKLKSVDWREKFSSLWERMLPYAKKTGRVAARPLLLFYFVVTDSETSTLEKALIYGCIAYVIMPFSILPRVIYRFVGIMDEAAAVLFVYSKIKDKITPAIEAKVETMLDAWFGAEYAVIS